MKNHILTIIIACLGFQGISQEHLPTKIKQQGFLQLDYLSLDMPYDPIFLDEPNMALTGIHYNLLFGNFYGGLGIYGAVTGKRGGFFTLGVNAGYKATLSERWFLDTGFHFGGGGGAGAPDGGGAFLMPRISLGHQFKHLALTAGYSYANFFDGGNMKSHQVRVGIEIPLALHYTYFKELHTQLTPAQLKGSAWDRPGKKIALKLLISSVQLGANAGNYFEESLDHRTIHLAGFELNSYINNRVFAFIRTDGGFAGIPAGYMDVFLGAGYAQPILGNNTFIIGKMGIGAAGGAGVNTRGGLLFYPQLALEHTLFKGIRLHADVGLIRNPTGTFQAQGSSVGLSYTTHINGTKDAQTQRAFTRVGTQGFETIVKHDYYRSVPREYNPTQDLHQISAQFNVFITPSFYIAGQTSFATLGNAGAYAEGLVGGGIQSKGLFGGATQLFAQVLAGGAGGASVSTGKGLIYKPSIGVSQQLNQRFKLRASAGRVVAYQGAMNSTFLSLGLSYRMAFLRGR